MNLYKYCYIVCYHFIYLHTIIRPELGVCYHAIDAPRGLWRAPHKQVDCPSQEKELVRLEVHGLSRQVEQGEVDVAALRRPSGHVYAYGPVVRRFHPYTLLKQTDDTHSTFYQQAASWALYILVSDVLLPIVILLQVDDFHVQLRKHWSRPSCHHHVTCYLAFYT